MNLKHLFCSITIRDLSALLHIFGTIRRRAKGSKQIREYVYISVKFG